MELYKLTFSKKISLSLGEKIYFITFVPNYNTIKYSKIISIY
jgi:hypothetical protein